MSDSGGSGLFIGALLLVGFVLYAYIAACMMVIARKTGTPNGWMAWIPILNVVLMCTMAGKPAWWVVLCFVPLVNLVVFVALWMAIAERRGKPSWAGLLMLVPPVSLIVPLWLASGDGGPAPAPSAPGAPLQSRPLPTGPARCPACGHVLEPDEAFCGSCGQPVARPTTVAPRPVAAASGGGGGMACCAGVGVLGLVVVGGGLAWFLLGGSGYRAPDRKPPAVPSVAAGTLRELPVDPSANSPARPEGLTTQTLTQGQTPELPDNRLPPGLDASSLSYLGTCYTSADFVQEERKGNVGVTVLDTSSNSQAQDKIVTKVRNGAGAGAKVTPIEVDAPDGQVYKGSKVAANGATTYVLANPPFTVVIVIYAAQPEGEALATRLASTAGNGQGAAAYPEQAEAFGTLPATLPADFKLTALAVYTEAQLLAVVNEAAAQGQQGGVPPEVQELLKTIRMFVPRQLVVADYRGPGGEWHTMVAEYGSPTQAWRNWQLLTWTLGFGGQGISVPAASGATSGFLFAENEPVLMFRAGPYLVVLGGPSGASSSVLTTLAGALQI